ncbi:MAG: imidazole glycerol phosphate synthase subunit HisH [Bacteroidales bacterium]|jgi:glutamine amidotransferase|nr:imidazole glycerol phosphate synthase subunit HisH [Bacteroidales bacterium]
MIAIVKYNAGNIKSVQNALDRLGFESVITNDPKEMKKADKVIFPGVGEAGSAMQFLKEKHIDKTITALEQPVLGICLGLQLLCRHTEESDTECLGIFDTNVKRFPPAGKIPHVGWNSFMSLHGNLFSGISLNDDVYYVHSYYAEISPHTTATCEYILPFSASMNRDNFYATQFHPEKSCGTGEKILLNFLQL